MLSVHHAESAGRLVHEKWPRCECARLLRNTRGLTLRVQADICRCSAITLASPFVGHLHIPGGCARVCAVRLAPDLTLRRRHDPERLSVGVLVAAHPSHLRHGHVRHPSTTRGPATHKMTSRSAKHLEGAQHPSAWNVALLAAWHGGYSTWPQRLLGRFFCPACNHAPRPSV